jgi:hypothetical protein
MQSDGYILLNRNFRRSWIWTRKERFDARSAFLSILFRAAYQPHKVEYSNRTVELERGQLVTSARVLAREWQWSEKKVRNWLVKWENAGVIRTHRSDAAGRLIEVCNYGFYQDPSNRRDDDKVRTADAPRTHVERKPAARENTEIHKYKNESLRTTPAEFDKCKWNTPNRCSVNATKSGVNSEPFYCHWHLMNVNGPRAADDRALFDQWLLTFDEEHPWRLADSDELWQRLQGVENGDD